MNTQTISTEYFELINKIADRYEENYGHWTGIADRNIEFYRNGWDTRNKLQALLAQGKAVLV